MREDVILAHAELESVCEHIHLPLQSGSTPILKAMRRTYSRERYLDRVALIREHVPGLRADDRHHRRLPGRDRGRLRADARGLRGGRLRRRLHVRLLAAARHRGGRARPTALVPHEVKVERMQRLVEVVQRRAHERAQRFVGPRRSRCSSRARRARTRAACAAARATARPSTSAAWPRPGELVPVHDHAAHQPDARRRAVAAGARAGLRPWSTPTSCAGSPPTSGCGGRPARTDWPSSSLEDATYSTSPYEPPYRGLAAIAELWERGRDGPDEAFDMTARDRRGRRGDRRRAGRGALLARAAARVPRPLDRASAQGRPLHALRGVAVRTPRPVRAGLGARSGLTAGPALQNQPQVLTAGRPASRASSHANATGNAATAAPTCVGATDVSKRTRAPLAHHGPRHRCGPGRRGTGRPDLTSPTVRPVCEHVFVRWDNLTIDQEQHAQLPGYREAAVVRHFDAPEALDTRFYEVRAKSALNRVPERSRMPFRWTINPYRGCSHACVYCAHGDTPILLADGRTRRLADVRLGDRILGTERRGRYRRYAETEVLAHWSTVKPAFRVTLEDGTELVTSGDHRFLTDRGWKHVMRAGPGERQRPHLTTSNSLLGTGGFAEPPEESADYRRGYLCGLIRGDGTLGVTAVRARDRPPLGPPLLPAGARRLRGAAPRASIPARGGCPHGRVRVRAGRRREAGGPRDPNAAPRRRRADRRADRVAAASQRRLAQGLPGGDLRRGGIVRRRGAAHRQHRSGAPRLDRRLSAALRVRCRPRRPRPTPTASRYVRLRGGLREHLRFFHTTDPAITRKRTITGTALKSDAKTKVVSIEPLGTELRAVRHHHGHAVTSSPTAS